MVQEAIAARVRPRMRRLAVSVENNVREAGGLAYQGIRPQVFTEDGQLRPLDPGSRSVTACASGHRGAT